MQGFKALIIYLNNLYRTMKTALLSLSQPKAETNFTSFFSSEKKIESIEMECAVRPLSSSWTTRFNAVAAWEASSKFLIFAVWQKWSKFPIIFLISIFNFDCNFWRETFL